MKTSLIFILFITPLALISCDKSTQKSSESDYQAATETPKTLPVGFPAEIPLFPGSTIFLTDARTPNGELHYNVTTEIDATKATPKQARDFYVTEMEKRGWPKGETHDNGTSGNYTYSVTRSPTDFSVITYLKADDESKTSINLVIMKYMPAK